MNYLRYDHSAGPGPTEDEFIGPFATPFDALRFKRQWFSHDAPISVAFFFDPPPNTMSPDQTSTMIKARL